jgi:hypothetical protein
VEFVGSYKKGKAIPLVTSDVDLSCDGENVSDRNSELADRALDVLKPQQKLYCSQVSRVAIDEGRFGSP